MTLNEAIREGCRLFPVQGYDRLFSRVTQPPRACALGALIAGLHGIVAGTRQHAEVEACALENGPAKWERPNHIYLEHWTFLDSSFTSRCPVPMCQTIRYELPPDWKWKLYAVIAHLNDDHKWTREAIAEWADPHPELHQPLPVAVSVNEEVLCGNA